MAQVFECTQCKSAIVVKFLNPGETAKCRSCGAPNAVPPERDDLATSLDLPMTITSDSPDAQPDFRYKGVKGWLLFLCVVLTILQPIGNGLIIYGSYLEARFVAFQVRGFMTFEMTSDVLVTLAVIFGVYAGVALWRVSRNAVTKAKAALLISALVVAVNTFLPLLIRLPEEIEAELMKNSPMDLGASLAPIALWYGYLKISKRVRATYETNS